MRRLLYLGLPMLPLFASGADLVHYYDFEENSNDRVGSSNGTDGAEVTTSAGFDGNTAATFPSGLARGNPFDDTGYIDLDPAIADVSGEFSFFSRVKLEVDETTNPHGIFDFSGDGRDGPQSLFIQSGGNENRMAFRVDGEGSSNVVAFVEVPENDTWFFITATFVPGGDLKIYLNGEIKETLPAGLVLDVSWDSQPYLGAFNVNSNTNRGLARSLDDFAIYSGVPTDFEASSLFDGTLFPTGHQGNSRSNRHRSKKSDHFQQFHLFSRNILKSIAT